MDTRPPNQRSRKRERSTQMSPATSEASLPSVAKQVRHESGGDKARQGPSSSVPAGPVAPIRDANDLAGVIPVSFLSVCSLCRKALFPGKGTYIYRGEVAFCSNECRELYIKGDEMMRRLAADSSGQSGKCATATVGSSVLAP